MAKDVQRREHFRIEFPSSERPSIIVNGRSHSVIDLSEQGIKVHWTNHDLPLIGNPLYGVVVFTDGSKVDIQGKVIRASGAIVIVNLTQGIPYPKMLAEQRRLIQKYKNK